MSFKPVQVVLFSAVDAVLRNPASASLAKASRAIRRLTEEGGSLVLCSNYTRAELERLQEELGISCPFVAEGGAAVFIPTGYFGRAIPSARAIPGYDVVEFGPPHAEVLAGLRRVAEALRIGIVRLSDMSVEEVAREWRLTLLRARLAKLREYLEPCYPRYTDAIRRPHFLHALRAARLRAIPHERCECVGGMADSSAGIKLLADLYRRTLGSFASIGVVDASTGYDVLPLTRESVIVHDDETCAGAVDVECWADSLLETVRERRAPEAVSAT